MVNFCTFFFTQVINNSFKSQILLQDITALYIIVINIFSAITISREKKGPLIPRVIITVAAAKLRRWVTKNCILPNWASNLPFILFCLLVSWDDPYTKIHRPRTKAFGLGYYMSGATFSSNSRKFWSGSIPTKHGERNKKRPQKGLEKSLWYEGRPSNINPFTTTRYYCNANFSIEFVGCSRSFFDPNQ